MYIIYTELAVGPGLLCITTDSHSGGVDASRPYLLHFTQEQCAINATPKRIVTFGNFAGQQWNCCESGYFQPCRPILCQHAGSASLNWIQPALACLCLVLQLQALASCPAPPPTLCACALYACSYSAAIRAYFLPNSLHSNVRKYTSHLSPPCMQST